MAGDKNRFEVPLADKPKDEDTYVSYSELGLIFWDMIKSNTPNAAVFAGLISTGMSGYLSLIRLVDYAQYNPDQDREEVGQSFDYIATTTSDVINSGVSTVAVCTDRTSASCENYTQVDVGTGEGLVDYISTVIDRSGIEPDVASQLNSALTETAAEEGVRGPGLDSRILEIIGETETRAIAETPDAEFEDFPDDLLLPGFIGGITMLAFGLKLHFAREAKLRRLS